MLNFKLEDEQDLLRFNEENKRILQGVFLMNTVESIYLLCRSCEVEKDDFHPFQNKRRYCFGPKCWKYEYDIEYIIWCSSHHFRKKCDQRTYHTYGHYKGYRDLECTCCWLLNPTKIYIIREIHYFCLPIVHRLTKGESTKGLCDLLNPLRIVLGLGKINEKLW